jgi:hypothetical protein
MLPFGDRDEDAKLLQGHQGLPNKFDQSQTEASDEQKSKCAE